MLPIFYQQTTLTAGSALLLDEDTSRHVVQVLRMQPGAALAVTDGQGCSTEAVVVTADKKRCVVQTGALTTHPRRQPLLHIAIAFTKHSGRNEWLLEKITELGVATIIPLITTRTERERIRYDRWQGILAAAMIQSQQFYLPVLQEAMPLPRLLAQFQEVKRKLIAHCIDQPERLPLPAALPAGEETLLLIGPEGDFTQEEVALCTGQGYAGVMLGGTRLRTETAAMAACAYFNMVNDEAD